jgi:O-glycosyl hydrolase
MTIDRRGFLRASTSALALQPGLRQLLAAPEHSSPTSGPPDVDRLAAREIAVYTTADNSDHRLSATDKLTFKPMGQPKETQVCVFVDPSRRFQTILGIGGALTDAAAETFAKLPPARQRELLEAYFEPDTGIGYTLGRTTIHSCDFSSSSYTYVGEGDRELKSFSVDHDRQFRIPFIKRAMTAARGALTLFCSPWSPPAFMKTNNDMLHGGQLRPEFAQSWATYFAKFIMAYEREGIRIWGTTVQNEPMATQTWESCIYSAEDERDFLKNYLGPTLKRAGLGDRKIIVWDHNRDLIYQRVSTILADPGAAQYVWGVGFHWYEPWSGGEPMFDNVTLVRETFPSQNLIFTEGCIGPFKTADLKNWRLGEAYDDQRLQRRRRRVDGLERPAGRTGRPEPRRELLLRAGARRYDLRSADLHELVFLHRALLEVRPPWCPQNRQLAQPKCAALDRLRQSRREGIGGGHEPRGSTGRLLSVG